MQSFRLHLVLVCTSHWTLLDLFVDMMKYKQKHIVLFYAI